MTQSGPENSPWKPTADHGLCEVEQVLVVPRKRLEAAGLLANGFQPGGIEETLRLVEEAGEFMPRPEAEESPAFKQIIPYAVVVAGGRVFLFKRSKRGGEPRLHDRFSIGVGGHINPDGSSPSERVEAGLRRELEEELHWDIPYRVAPMGRLNDDSNSVGAVHFALVYRVETATPGVRVRETEILEGQFEKLQSLKEHYSRMETWSQLVSEALFEDPDLVGAPEFVSR